MLEPEVATLRDILLGMATNSDFQATKWAREIIENLQLKGYRLQEEGLDDLSSSHDD